MAAMIALILMAAKDCGSADLDGAHDPQMIAGQPMGFSICRAVLTEDVRHLKTARCSHPFSGLRSLFFCFIEGTYDLGQVQPADMQIDGGRCGGPVAEKKLDMMETRSRFNQMGRKAVPQRMHAGRFCDAGEFLCFIKELLYRIRGYMVILLLPIK
jgi:hypothetical protein